MLVGNVLFFNYADVIENCILVWETYKDHATKELMSTFVLFYQRASLIKVQVHVFLGESSYPLSTQAKIGKSSTHKGSNLQSVKVSLLVLKPNFR